MAKRRYEVDVGQRVVMFEELSASDMINVFQSAQASEHADARNMAVSLSGLQYSIRSIDGRPVTYQELTSAWDDLFSLPETTVLQIAWAQVHTPDAAAMAAAKGNGLRALATGPT